MSASVRVCLLAAVLVLAPATARGEWFLFPFAAANTGGDTSKDSGAYGGSFGWTGRWIGAEGEFAWSPEFFDAGGGFRTKHKGMTVTGTALVGPQARTWRPYGAIGLGVLRSEIGEVGGLAELTDNRAALHAGGGLMWQNSNRFSLRGDVRYVRALDDTEPEGNVFAERLADFSYWRAGGGIVFRW